MFGKRNIESLGGCIDDSLVQQAASEEVKNIIPILNYIFSSCGGDTRPYLTVDILGLKIKALLDSGSTRTIFGTPGWDFIRSLGLKIRNSSGNVCIVANGTKCSIFGSVDVPFSLEGRIRTISALVVPELPQTLILGMDFWKSMEIVPDFRKSCWTFGLESSNEELFLNAIESNDTLSTEQSEKLNNIINKYFDSVGSKLGKTSLVDHKIILTNPEPIKLRPYRVSPKIQELIDNEVKYMLDNDIIESSKSAFSFPVVMVPKKERGKYRFCVDYRQLNKVTKKDAYPLPYISTILDKLRNARYLSSVDVKSAFFQVPIANESREYTAFTIPGRGLYQFKRMPFGLSNSPATFQRLMDRILGPELEPYAFVYLDDIIILSNTFEKHVEILEEIFKRLSNAGLTLSKDKCKFCRPELEYLGYVIDKRGLHVNPNKVKAILNIPTPKNVNEIRRVIGTASWYRRFIPNFSTIIAPMTDLLKKHRKWSWTEDCENSFRKIKDCLVSAPILSCPDFRIPFQVQTDASAFGIGAVLTQHHEDGEHVVAYISRSLTRAERNFSTVERECLAIVWAVEKLRAYLEGYSFIVVTDHHSLTWLHNLPQPAGRLARWILRLQQFDFKIIHRKGRENVVPDMLSRTVPEVSTVSVEEICQNIPSDIKDNWYKKQYEWVSKNPLRFPLWRIENSTLYKRVFNSGCNFTGSEYDWKEVVPKEIRRSILIENHDNPTAGHCGIYKTFHRVSNRYYWPKMKADISKYIINCKVCQAHKPIQRPPSGLLCGRPDIQRPWELISIDIVGPLPKSSSGFCYILSIQDYFSKFCIFQPMRQANAKSICKILEEHVFLLFGVPHNIICDNGKQFISKEFQSLAKTYNVNVQHVAFYHPQANPCERQHRTLKAMLSCYAKDNQRTWDQYLQKVACAIRTAKNETTSASPFFVNFGREIKLNGSDHRNIPVNEDGAIPSSQSKSLEFSKLFKNVRERLDKAFAKSKHNYDLRRRDVQYNVGQRVWRKNYVQSDAPNYFTAKLAPKFVGPFIVCERLSPWTYKLTDGNNRIGGVWHCKDLKPYVSND